MCSTVLHAAAACVSWLSTYIFSSPNVNLQAKPLLRGVVLLMLPGLCRSLFAKRSELLPNMTALLGKPAVVMAPNAMVHPGETSVPYI